MSSKTTCSKCNNELEQHRVGKYRYCINCHNNYMKLHRPKHSKLSKQQRMKANCRSYLNVYLKRGKITKQHCSVCGSAQSEAHHNDYTKPLEVIWLCKYHHLEYHYKISDQSE